jgi:hypothetical protein
LKLLTKCDWPNFNTSVGLLEVQNYTDYSVIGYEFFAPENPCSCNPISSCSWGSDSAHDDDGEEILHLWLVDNALSGTLVEELGLLTSLQSLGVQTNKDVRGSIPSTVGVLSNLNGIGLSFVNLEGTPLPSEIGLCTNLRFLFTENSHLGGSIPTEIGRMESLEIFSVGENLIKDDLNRSLVINSMTGTIPTELGLLSNKLRWVYAHSSGFEGPLPSELGLLTSVTDLDLVRNSKHGWILSLLKVL